MVSFLEKSTRVFQTYGDCRHCPGTAKGRRDGVNSSTLKREPGMDSQGKTVGLNLELKRIPGTCGNSQNNNDNNSAALSLSVDYKSILPLFQ